MDEVDILLAVYKPNMIWFKKQLDSLNNQTYKYIKLLVRDDSSDEEWFDKISRLVSKCITTYEYTIYRNEHNLGSNTTFGLLTADAQGDFVAYCDQDDYWEKDKVEKLVQAIKISDAVLSYCNLSVINANGVLIASELKKVNPRIKQLYGEGKKLFSSFVRKNCITGCTSLVKTSVAKKALPFPEKKYYIHDHWIAINACTEGSITFVNELLVKYRVHSGQQVGITSFYNVDCATENYLKNKLYMELEQYNWLINNSNFDEELNKIIYDKMVFVKRRISYFEKVNIINLIGILSQMHKEPLLVLGEIFIRLVPLPLVMASLSFIRKNIMNRAD